MTPVESRRNASKPCLATVLWMTYKTTNIQHQLNLIINSLQPASIATGRVEYVKMNVIVCLLIAATASARHVRDGQFNIHDINSDVVIVKRNNEYISKNPGSTPYVNKNFRQTDKPIRIKTNERLVQPTVKYNEYNQEDSLNNISSDENDYRLRTNAYTTQEYSTTEYIVQDVHAYTNRKEQNYNADRNPVNQGAITRQGYHQSTHNAGFIKYNKPKSSQENRPALNKNQERRRPETSINIPIQNPQNERTKNITNRPKEPVGVLETVLIQPLPSEQTREGIDRLPKTDTDEQIWVWGTERTNVTSTEPGSLDNRAAFKADQCPTGMAKVKGICVEKH